MSQLFAWSGQSTGVSALASFLPKKSQGLSPSEWANCWISLQSKGLSRVFSNTTVQKHFPDQRWHLLSFQNLLGIYISAVNCFFTSVQFSSVTQSCLTLCDSRNRSTPGLPVHHQLPEFTQTHVHRVHDAIQPSHPGSSPSPPAPNLSQHQSLFQWVETPEKSLKSKLLKRV